ncbi:MAG: SCO family protein [Burkholderiaceae bacterium]|nr:SCO family protein [Burkholderiaceae bacterium]
MAVLKIRRALLCGAVALTLAGCDQIGGGGAPAFKSVDITGADYARELNLPDADGQARSLADFRGKVVVVFFGFTQCPDVCPTTLAELAAAKQLLGPAGADVQGIFVSVDPARDTPAVLKSYVGSFGTDIVALHGNEDQIKAAAKAFKVYYAKVPGKTETTYTIDHTAASYVYDRQGRVRLFTRYGTGPEALAHDLKILLDEKPAS